jgi:hypothetical protein
MLLGHVDYSSGCETVAAGAAHPARAGREIRGRVIVLREYQHILTAFSPITQRRYVDASLIRQLNS